LTLEAHRKLVKRS